MRITVKLLLVLLAQLFAPSVLAGNYNCDSRNFGFASGGTCGIFPAGSLPKPMYGEAYTLGVRPYNKKGEYNLANNVDEGREFTINTELAEYYYHQGNTYYYLDEYRSAIMNYNEAINLRPNYAEAYYYRGLAYERNGLFKKALADLRTALSKNSFSISVNKLNSEAQKKIMEVEKKISEVAEIPSQTSTSHPTVDANLLK